MSVVTAITRVISSVRLSLSFNNMSLLAQNFNALLCQALNLKEKLGLTHFVLMHADVCPQDADWLTRLLAIQEDEGVDVLSCVIPIKDGRGLTSTALDLPNSGPVAYRQRRLTTTEVLSLPATFNAETAARRIEGFPGDVHPTLLLNTGLMSIRLDAPWLPGVRFTINDAIQTDSDGMFVPRVEPEDWNFSRQLSKLGVQVAATRELDILHVGHKDYSNRVAWGEPIDKGFSDACVTPASK